MHVLDIQYVAEVDPTPICTLLPLYRNIYVSLYFRVMKIVGIESWNFRIQLFNSTRKDFSTKPCSESLYSFSETYLTTDCRCKVSQNHIDPHACERVFRHHEMCGRVYFTISARPTAVLKSVTQEYLLLFRLN